MTTKTLTGSYPSGYYVRPQYQGLTIDQSATIGGSGITTSTSQPTAIDNYGQVRGTQNGISLSGGGTITNQNAGSPGLIEGVTAIVATGGFATVSNAGMIKSGAIVSGYKTTTGITVTLEAGGKVTQVSADAQITNGVSISGGAGSVTNRGTIGGSIYKYSNPKYQSAYYKTEIDRIDPSVTLTGGGTVNNGANGVTSAMLTSGVTISGGTGSVINNGTIQGAIYNNYGYDNYEYRYASIVLKNGGTVQNGTGSNTSATLSNGILLSGGATTIANNGKIGSSTFTYIGGHIDSTFPQYAISASSHLTLTNGSASNTAAQVDGTVVVSGATATISNFGTITSPRVDYHGDSTTIVLANGGVITNGSATSSAATISGPIAINFSGTGSITNFGTIESTVGKTIVFASGNATLIEEGTGIISGKVVGDGQNALLLDKLGGTGSFTSLGINVTGFKTTSVAAGATWTFTGANKIISGATLTDNGALTLAATLNNSGTVVIAGSLALGSQGRLNDVGSASKTLLGNAAQVTGTGSINNAGLIQKNAGGSTATIATKVTNTGTIDVAQGTLDITGAIVGTGGMLAIEAQRTLRLGGSVAAGQTATFAASTGTLGLDDAPAFRGQISGFVAGDAVDLSGFASTSTSLSFAENANGKSGVLKVTSGSKTASLTILGTHTPSAFHLATDKHGGSLMTYGTSATVA